jgi:hypothetical protein
MNLSDIRAITRRPRRAKTLLERARKYIGSVKGPLKPRDVAAQAKALVRGIIAEKHSR